MRFNSADYDRQKTGFRFKLISDIVIITIPILNHVLFWSSEFKEQMLWVKSSMLPETEFAKKLYAEESKAERTIGFIS